MTYFHGLRTGEDERPPNPAKVPLSTVFPMRDRTEKRTASDYLDRASALLTERGKQYDKPEGERSMAATVAAFNAMTGRDLSEAEGWAFMATLKLVRNFSRDKPHADSLDDLIAYSALLAEASFSEGV